MDTDLRFGFCPPDEDGLRPRHIVDTEVVRRDEQAMRVVEYFHETCRNCGANDDKVIVLDYSLPFEASMLGVPNLTLN